MAVPEILRFPNPVNEVSARLVAAGVVLMSVAILAGQHWILVPLAFGFVARVAAGPRFSPLALLVTKVVTPRLAVDAKLVPGPPKRFAQGVGAVLSISALISWGVLDSTPLALVLVAAITIAATLESVFAYCLGCKVFALLMRVGIIPPEVCEACNDLSLRSASAEVRRPGIHVLGVGHHVDQVGNARRERAVERGTRPPPGAAPSRPRRRAPSPRRRTGSPGCSSQATS